MLLAALFRVRELWEHAGNWWDKILLHDSRYVLVVADNAINQALIATPISTCHLFCGLALRLCILRIISPHHLFGFRLGTDYFMVLLQSNNSVSVLDFTPRLDDLPPYVCLNGLNEVNSLFMGGTRYLR